MSYPRREDRGMEAHLRPAPDFVSAEGPAATAADLSERLPEGVYRRRRLVVVCVVAAALVLVLAGARPDRVPPGEANPWPSTGAASVPAEIPGVYVVQPGDTLWGIARTIAPGADPRAVVHDLSAAAGGAALAPGQPIVIEAVPARLAASGSEAESRRPAADALAGPDK